MATIILTACVASGSGTGLGDPNQHINYQFSRNIFSILGDSFNLPNETPENPAVLKQINWFVSHPAFLKRMAEQSRPYLYYILQQVNRRGLPTELVLLPIIESAYNPFAYSSVGAAGLWQMMPGTASGFGLKVDWWYDGRRDIIASTNSALNYLSYLGNYFNDNWMLAIAAYDTGEGRVNSAIQHNLKAGLPTDFFNLPLPADTKTYVPKLLALATIIKHPYEYPIDWPNIPNAPYLSVVNVGSQIDLSRAAKMSDLSLQTLSRLNPGFNRWATDPDGPYTIVLPIDKAARFQEALNNLEPNQRVTWIRYTVKNGDTLSVIAYKNKTTTDLIKKVNRIKYNNIHADQVLLIPLSSSKLTSIVFQSEKRYFKSSHSLPEIHLTTYLVQHGDTLSKIAKKYHVKESAIRFWNGLRTKQELTVGAQLIIWPHRQKSHTTSTSRHSGSPKRITYRVKSGDTLSNIAYRYKVKASSIKHWNQLSSDVVKANQILVMYR